MKEKEENFTDAQRRTMTLSRIMSGRLRCIAVIFILRWCHFLMHASSAAAYLSKQMPVTFDLQPTGALLYQRRHLLDTNATFPISWGQRPAVYATIPDPDDPQHAEDDDLQHFHRHRHLSRYEIQYRQQNGMDLQLDWDGTYDGTNASHRRWLLPKRAPSFQHYQAVPLSQGYGTHYANLWIGSPHPQRKTLIVDTGSHYMAFPCVGCQNCGDSFHTDPYFDPRKSKTFHRLQCDECRDGIICQKDVCLFEQAYTEGSTWEAIQVRDRVFCSGSDALDAADPRHERYAIDFMFGCQTTMSGLFVTQLADGIIGMSAHPATLPKQMYDKGKLEHNMFALCYRRELGTSKRGVHAGSMTLGGVSTSLDSGPIVYAQNIVKFGWFTVYVKNIYIRSGGGSSTLSSGSQKIVKVRMDVAAFNSGKGVIVDSGTTDTYLNQQVAKEFNKAWIKITGSSYSNMPITLTKEQLNMLPTILIQCQAFSAAKDPSIENYDGIPGYTGSLDPSSPNDLLLAIPATSYMDFSPITGRYMSRLYFTESAGSVLGSNAMQGHNVVFDWENGRVGFAESSCTYDKKYAPEASRDVEHSGDCVVSDPVLTRPCLESVDKELCENNLTSIALLGTERWTSVVEHSGFAAENQESVTCNRAAAALSHSDPRDHPVVRCLGEGVCEEERPCQLTCAELARAMEVKPLPEERQSQYRCGDSSWGACDVNCKQARIKAVAFSDGTCHEVDRETRNCHIHACAEFDSCRVPYVVHTVVGIRGATLSTWTEESQEMFSKILVAVMRNKTGSILFEEGDINVLTALPWYDDDNDLERKAKQTEVEVAGFRIVAEIAVFAEATQSQSDLEYLTKPLHHTARNPTNVNCDPDATFAAAKLALQIKQILRDDEFMVQFAEEIKRTLTDSNIDTVFAPLLSDNFRPYDDILVLAWTISTTIDDQINMFGPQSPHMATLYIILRISSIISTMILVVLTLWSAAITCYHYVQGNVLSAQSSIAYQPVAASEDALYAEEQAMRGRSNNSSTPGFKSHKLTSPKKRARANFLS